MSTKKDIFFYEKQYFLPWWVWGLLGGINAAIIYQTIREVIEASNNSDHITIWTMIAVTTIIFVSCIIILFAKVETTISNNGITTRHTFIKNKFPWEDISHIYLREVNAVTEFGGYGARYGNKRNIAYLTPGNMGLQIEFKDRKKFLIGTKKSEEIEQILKELGKIK